MPLEMTAQQLGVGLNMPMFGPRTGREANSGAGGFAVAASTDAQVELLLEYPAGPLDVLQIIAIGAKVSPRDGSGQLSLIGLDFCVYSSTTGTGPGTFQNLPLNYQPPPILTMPKASSLEISMSVVAPPPLRRLDLDGLNVPGSSPDRFIIAAALTFRNADAVGPHSLNAALDVVARIITGGDSI